jgi:outer membrane protein
MNPPGSITVIALLLAAVARPAGAQAGDSVLTLAAALRQALGSHPAVAGAEAAARGADAATGEARAAWWPRLTTSASLTRFEEPMIVFPLHGFDRPITDIAFDRTLLQGTATLAWTVFDGGERGARVRSAARAAEARGAALSAAETDLAADVTRRYLAALTARAVLEAREDAVRALSAEAGRVRQLVTEGEAPEVSLLRVRSALAEADAERLAGTLDLEVALRALARAVGVEALEPDALRPVRPAAAPSPRDSLLATAVAANPRLAEARATAEASRAARRAAAAAWFPELVATGALVGYGSGNDALDTEWQVGLRLSYPLFLGGQRARAVSRAGAEATAAEARYRALRLDVEDALDAAVGDLAAARARVGAAESSVAYLGEVARVELLSLEAGAGTEAEYLRAVADVRRARAGLAEARAAEVLAHVQVGRLTGTLTPEWVERTLETIR